jgi:hypothetical protein
MSDKYGVQTSDTRSASDMFFNIDGKRYPATFEFSELPLGRSVYVTWNPTGQPEFSLHRSEGAELFSVSWITPSDSQAHLQRPRKPDPLEIERLTAVVGARCNPATVAHAAEVAVGTMRPEFSYRTDEFERTELSRLLRAARRIELCRQFMRVEAGKILLGAWQSLVEYHLLTCFDLLGQPADWMNAYEWLSSSRPAHIQQRNAILEPRVGLPQLEVTKALLQGYNDNFGARRSFVRFIREILPDEVRAELLASIRVHRNALPPVITELPEGDDSYKEEFLYRIRNEYTHQARERGGFHPDFVGMRTDGDWVRRVQEIRGEDWITVMTRGWPELLEKVVVEGLVSRIRTLAAQS